MNRYPLLLAIDADEDEARALVAVLEQVVRQRDANASLRLETWDYMQLIRIRSAVGVLGGMTWRV